MFLKIFILKNIYKYTLLKKYIMFINPFYDDNYIKFLHVTV